LIKTLVSFQRTLHYGCDIFHRLMSADPGFIAISNRILKIIIILPCKYEIWRVSPGCLSFHPVFRANPRLYKGFFDKKYSARLLLTKTLARRYKLIHCNQEIADMSDEGVSRIVGMKDELACGGTD